MREVNTLEGKTMTSTNNYNTSTTGINISFNGCMDTQSARDSFEENFESLQHDGYRTTSINFYNPQGELKLDTSLKVKGLKRDLFNFVDAEITCGYKIGEWTKLELIDEIINHCEYNLKDYRYDLNDYILTHDLQSTSIEIDFVNDIDVLSTTGYSQGDYALVIVDYTQLTKVWGKRPDKLQGMIDNYFWDCPVYAVLEINGTEYQYFDYDFKQYEFEREAFINRVSKDANIKGELLEDLIPEDLSYT